MTRHAIILGAGKRGGAARPLPICNQIRRHIAASFYPTPPEAVRALLSVESFDGSIQEPACGQGHISRALLAAGHEVVSADLNDFGFGETGQDFLAQAEPAPSTSSPTRPVAAASRMSSCARR